MAITLVLFATLAFAWSISGQEFVQSRMIDGNIVDTLRRFPHHVNIITKSDENTEIRRCSGSIISEKWILTSIGCVEDGEWFDIQFHRKRVSNSKETFTVSVPELNVNRYPTEFDDLALIELPVVITFTDEIKPITLFKGDRELDTNFVVMPGYDESDDDKQLTYGMFVVMAPKICKARYGSVFDEYLEICTRGWHRNGQSPCKGNEGGGLITGWPQNPLLIAVFSKTPENCKNGELAIYTKIPKYFEWIYQISGVSAPGVI